MLAEEAGELAVATLHLGRANKDTCEARQPSRLFGDELK